MEKDARLYHKQAILELFVLFDQNVLVRPFISTRKLMNDFHKRVCSYLGLNRTSLHLGRKSAWGKPGSTVSGVARGGPGWPRRLGLRPKP